MNEIYYCRDPCVIFNYYMITCKLKSKPKRNKTKMHVLNLTATIIRNLKSTSNEVQQKGYEELLREARRKNLIETDEALYNLIEFMSNTHQQVQSLLPNPADV